MKKKVERHKLFSAVFIIFKKGNKILLARRYNTGHEDGNFGLPSGHIEKGETFAECAIREAYEEVGVKIKKKDLKLAHFCHNYYSSTTNPAYINIFYICEKWSGELKNCEPEKCDELRWVPMNNLPKNTIHYVEIVIKAIRNKQILTEIQK